MKQALQKKIRFVLAILMVMVTTISGIMPTTAFAKDTYSLTLKNTGTTDHTFDIYQIFKGNVTTEGNQKILSNIEWGNGVKKDAQTTLGDAKAKAESLKNSEENAKAFAESLHEKGQLQKPTVQKVTAQEKEKTVTGLEAGYYLIKDKDNSQTGENGAYTLFILKIVGDTEASTKLGVPTVEKNVQENSNGQWQDAADYNIGDSIPFKVTGTLPSNYDKYEKYKYSFHDQMSQGLTLQKDSIKVTIDGKDISSDKYELTKTENSFTLKFQDLKKIANITKDSKIVVEYSAKLNENAVIGANGNDNTAHLEYSNNPNKGGDGETGTTPKDKNIVFTYQVDVNKLNEQNKPLTGAEFELLKKEGKTEKSVKKFTVDTAGTKFTAKGLDAGEYILRETKTPDGYNTIKDVTFTIKATYDTKSDDPKLNNLTGETIDLGILKFTPDKNKGSLSTDVVNKKGFTLPETGGMGRTLIYIMGGIFVVAALGYMGYKKRHADR